MSYKKILTIQDISCVGQCSLTVALPVISACGIETCVLPSAVLSTHTAGFSGYTFRDLTDDMPSIKDHWAKENIKFDAVYTGYLCSPAQVNNVISAIKYIKNEETLIVVDPVMGDNGYSYSGFLKSFPSYMLRLCQKADIITPNVTEACLMLSEEYSPPPYTKKYIESLLLKLSQICKGTIVLTGACLSENEQGAAAYSATDG